ncbi:MAG: hypothetical protein ACO263_08995 [Cyclobacteriaceae bacterium]
MRFYLLIVILLHAGLATAQIIREPLQAIGMDGKYVSLQAEGIEGVVVFFTDTRCP